MCIHIHVYLYVCIYIYRYVYIYIYICIHDTSMIPMVVVPQVMQGFYHL